MAGEQADMGKQIKIMLMAVRGLAAGYPWITVAVAMGIGLLIGWFALGWWIAPINWTDARPVRLSSSEGRTPYRQYYLQLTADAYTTQSVAPISEVAKRLGIGDGWTKQQVLDELQKMIDAKQPGADRLARLQSALSGFQENGPSPAAPPAAGPSLLTWLVLIVVVVIAVVLGWLLLQRRNRAATAALTEDVSVTTETSWAETSAPPAPPVQAAAPPVNKAHGAPHPVQKTTWAGESTPPLAQYVTTYALGDDRYDVSFSIETSTGDFLGECGVGISETIGVGNPDKVTALEVWLFDKNDIRTLTKVLMSESAYNDQALRAKLAPKGEAMLVKKGEITTLTTQTLKVNARIVDLQYGSSNLPANSFFQQVTIELAAWSTSV